MALSEPTTAKIKELFAKMDLDGDGSLTAEESEKHFKSFAKVATKAMFKEVCAKNPPWQKNACKKNESVPSAQVDVDGDKSITLDEFIKFFEQVMAQKEEDGSARYTDEDVLETVDDLIKGEAWVDCERRAHACHCYHHRCADALRLLPPAQSWTVHQRVAPKTSEQRGECDAAVRRCGGATAGANAVTFCGAARRSVRGAGLSRCIASRHLAARVALVCDVRGSVWGRESGRETARPQC